MDFNWETETLVYLLVFWVILRKVHGFYLGNRDPGFHFSVFEMDNGICKYRKQKLLFSRMGSKRKVLRPFCDEVFTVKC